MAWGPAFAPAAQGLVEFTGYTNTNLFTGQALGPDLDRLRLIGAPAAVIYSIIITAPTIKFFIIGAALLPLVCRESFDTLHPPSSRTWSSVCLSIFSGAKAPPRPVVKRHDTNGNEFPSQISNRQTPKPEPWPQIFFLKNPFS